jgi:hypothetical protein
MKKVPTGAYGTSRTLPDARSNKLWRSRLTPRRSGMPSAQSYHGAKPSYFRDISFVVNFTAMLLQITHSDFGARPKLLLRAGG